jgi:hypothetical protein
MADIRIAIAQMKGTEKEIYTIVESYTRMLLELALTEVGIQKEGKIATLMVMTANDIEKLIASEVEKNTPTFPTDAELHT